MNNEQQSLIDEAYENYCKEYENGTHRIGTGLLWMAKETKDTFVYRSKADSDFSEKWGLKIEERDLSYEERKKLCKLSDRVYPDNEWMKENNIPTQLITITYQDQKIESYE